MRKKICDKIPHSKSYYSGLNVEKYSQVLVLKAFFLCKDISLVEPF